MRIIYKQVLVLKACGSYHESHKHSGNNKDEPITIVKLLYGY